MPLIVYLPILHRDIVIDKPGGLINRKDWLWPRTRSDGPDTFISAGPLEVAISRLPPHTLLTDAWRCLKGLVGFLAGLGVGLMWAL